MEKTFDIVESADALTPAATGKDVYEIFLGNPDLLCIAIVENELPVGLINRTTFFNRFGDQFGRALYEKRPATMLMDATPVIVDAGAPLPNWNDMPAAPAQARYCKALSSFVRGGMPASAACSRFIARRRFVRTRWKPCLPKWKKPDA